MRQEAERRIVRFGAYEVDLRESRLTKTGIRVRLQEQPFQILVLLLERAGQLVTREEIRQRLWSDNTFVEFDNALNTAVGKLRSALNDSADNPRFLETIPRKGYRFVAPVSLLPETQSSQSRPQTPTPETATARELTTTPEMSQTKRAPWRRFVWAGLAARVFCRAEFE